MKYLLPLSLTFSLGAFSPALFAQSRDCMEQVATDLHKAYCLIVDKDPLVQLPSLADFKNNDPQIQRILLSRHAERLGVTLPKPQAALVKNVEKAPSKALTRIEQTRKDSPAPRSRFDNCSLGGAEIRCETLVYQLQTNKRNGQLRAEAFGAENILELPKKENTEFASESDYRYLSFIYPRYLYKMLELGLGDSTMSFTKFATVYWQSKADSVDFSERFKEMYDRLKLEKSRNSVVARYRDNYPSALHQCMRVDDNIIVCDDMAQNWVYKLL